MKFLVIEGVSSSENRRQLAAVINENILVTVQDVGMVFPLARNVSLMPVMARLPMLAPMKT
jgi:hypothetical protein